MISFSQKIKSELLRREAPAYCCAAAELASYILVLGKDSDEFVNISAENELLISHIVQLIKKVLKSNVNPLKIGSTYSLMLPKGQKFKEKYACFYDGLKESLVADIYKKDCCRAAFIKGIFIASGSIVNPEKNYSLEFSFKDKALLNAVSFVFKQLNLELKEAVRKSSDILYTKNSNIICDFLTRIGAHNEYMQILNLKIERELRNDFNRAVNSEIANMDKTIKASIKHITAIEKIKDKKGLEILPDELYELAVLRLENKNMSISELALNLKEPITKSGVNHRLNKIMKIADTL